MRAFSLVELLVVVLVIAVLIGLAIPALSSARDAARATRCLANIRSLGSAVEAYKDANSGRYPFANHTADVRFEFTAPYPVIGTMLGVSPPGTDEEIARRIEPFVCPADNPAGAWSGFSYIYRPWDMMATWPGPDPQLGVSRVLAALPQEVIFVEAVYRHHGTGAAYRNDGAAYLQKPTPR